jgi:hypothetical protein
MTYIMLIVKQNQGSTIITRRPYQQLVVLSRF